MKMIFKNHFHKMMLISKIQSLTWTALPLCCFGKTTCTISVGSWYYCYENDGTSGQSIPMNVPGPQFSEKIYYCEKCFGDGKGDT